MAEKEGTIASAIAGDAVSEGNTKEASEEERGSWGSPVEFVLALIGYAVGLGNVWRFPYLCYRNGGGAFLLPYFLMMVFVGLPIFFLELYYGQFSGVGPATVFTRFIPAFSGLGYANLMVISLLIIYYMVIVAWTLFYTFMSFNPDLGWGSCDFDFNSLSCYSGNYEVACAVNNTNTPDALTYWQKICYKVGDICKDEGFEGFNSTHCRTDNGTFVRWNTLIERTLASEEYYNNFVLGRADDVTWENFGTIQWHLVGCLFLSWAIAGLCVVRGVQSMGKVVYFTALFPYVILTALVIRGVTLEGAIDGILFYISPDWDQLNNARVWGDAASQIFYSFGVGLGSLITLGSYNKFRNNCHFDAVFVSITNFLTAIYAGFAIFSVLGFLANTMGVEVGEVAKDGPGLAFVAYPEAILQMPLPQLWAILFFFMLFILGLGSQFGGIEAINSTFLDRFPQYRNQKWKVTLVTCTCCFLLGLPMCWGGGVYLFSLMDWNVASWAILLIGCSECVALSWCYGATKGLNDLRGMGMKLPKIIRAYWWFDWTIAAPFFCITVFIFIKIQYTPAEYEGYLYPDWAIAIGWMIGLATIVPIPIGFLYIFFIAKVRGKALFRPTEAWLPNGVLEDDDDESKPIASSPPIVVPGEDNPGFDNFNPPIQVKEDMGTFEMPQAVN